MISINKLETLLEEGGIIFLTYGGLFTQSLIAGMTEALEKETQTHDLSMKTANDIFVIFIELAQNIMNYSKMAHDDMLFDPKGLIFVGKKEDHYRVCSQNIISASDKAYLEPKLEKIVQASKDEIKQYYKEARRAKRDIQRKGSGLGFLEIAKKSSHIEYLFQPLSNGTFHFKLCATL